MSDLNTLKPDPGSTHKRKRIGRGPGSGHGKTAARGSKGMWSRSGSSQKRGFEGGQMPLHRRLPKRGFTNARFKKEFSIVNVSDLVKFDKGSKIGPQELLAAGLIRKLEYHGVDHPAVADGRLALFGKAFQGRRTRAPEDHDLHALPDGCLERCAVGRHRRRVTASGSVRRQSRNRLHINDHAHADDRYGVHYVAG